MRFLLILLAVALLRPLGAEAQTRGEAFDLTRLDAGPRAAALGGAAEARPGSDPALLFANPALLTPETAGRASLTYLDHVADLRGGTVAYARELGGLGTAALGVRFFSYGSFERSSPDGATDETFDAYDASATLSLARSVSPRVRVGGSVHALFSRLDTATGQAFTLDAGATYTIPDQKFVAAATVRHLGVVTSSLGETADQLPLDVRVSVSKGLRYLPLTLSLTGTDLTRPEAAPDSSALSDVLRHVAVGGELDLGSSLSVRLGYRPRLAQDLSSNNRLSVAGMSAGFGIALRRIAVDYAYRGWAEFGTLHRFGVNVRL